MKKLLTKIARTSSVILLICGLAYWINPGERFRINLDKFDIPECEVTKSEHIVGCGIDIQEAETVFLQLRQFLDAQDINAKVKIYKANKVLFDNIGYIEGSPVGGIYLEGIFNIDTIIYNGNRPVLKHELAHHFYSHMGSYRRNEAFAQMAGNYFAVLGEYILLRQRYTSLQDLTISRLTHFKNREKL